MLERCKHCNKEIDIKNDRTVVAVEDGEYLCCDCAFQDGYDVEGHKISLSPQAQKFLKEHYQFTEQVAALEKEFEVNGVDLKKAKELTDFIVDNADFPLYHWHKETENDFYGEVDYSDFDEEKVTDICYYLDDGRLALEVYTECGADVTLFGNKRDYNWYEPPIYDEVETHVTAIVRLVVIIPTIPTDFDSYDIIADEEAEYEEY